MLLSVWVTQSEVCGGPLQFLKFNFCGGILTWSRRKEHKWPKFYVRSPRECRAEWDGLGCQSGAPDEAVKIQKSHQQIKQHDEGKQSVFCQVGYFVWMCICVVFKSTVEKKKKKLHRVLVEQTRRTHRNRWRFKKSPNEVKLCFCAWSQTAEVQFQCQRVRPPSWNRPIKLLVRWCNRRILTKGWL